MSDWQIIPGGAGFLWAGELALPPDLCSCFMAVFYLGQVHPLAFGRAGRGTLPACLTLACWAAPHLSPSTLHCTPSLPVSQCSLFSSVPWLPRLLWGAGGATRDPHIPLLGTAHPGWLQPRPGIPPPSLALPRRAGYELRSVGCLGSKGL